MGESFEAKLIAASSKEVFKKAKKIMHSKEILCCHEAEPGVLHAVCRDSTGFVSHAELRGFPDGPFSGACTCSGSFPGFCPHSMAAALYHAKYTIKYHEEDIPSEAPARYAGLKFSKLPELLTQLLAPQTCQVKIELKSEFPHLPSKWERIIFRCTICNGTRVYSGSLPNLRKLHFDKVMSSMFITNFPSQDRQIIRYLALQAEQEGTSDLSLDAEQFAELFHCMIGFERFTKLGEKVIIHGDSAVPALLLEKLKSGFVFHSAITVKGSPLPLKDVKVIAGRNGCWVGMLGEYWWISAQADVLWIRNFLRTTLQSADGDAVKLLLDSRDMLPLKIIPGAGFKTKERKFRPVYTGKFTEHGDLVMDVQFDYGGHLCKADQERLAASHGTSFWKRNVKGEFEVLRELQNFGFHEVDEETAKKLNATRLILSDSEAAGMFLEEVVSRWYQEKRDCLLSGDLAVMSSESSRISLKTILLSQTKDFFILALTVTGGQSVIRWKELTEAAVRNETFMRAACCPGRLLRIPAALRILASNLETVCQILQPDPKYPDADIVQIPRLAAWYWAESASDLPGAVPKDFLRMQIDLEDISTGMQTVRPESENESRLFQGTLRSYQAAGVYWMNAMAQRGCNPILADEMGLGKTIQTLALLSENPKGHLPALVVCPTSLTDNWQTESLKFMPGSRVMNICGPNRKDQWNKAGSCDICITSYALAKRDIELIREIPFRYVILDEAQHIKNPESQNAQACKQIQAEHRLVLTGTPLENSAMDLWSIFDFLHPGLLGPVHAFRGKYGDISRDRSLQHQLSRRIAPFILRRKKADVCRELPQKQEQLLFCSMDEKQRALYETFAEQARIQCGKLLAGDGKVSGMHILAALTKLRQICCDPALLPDGAAGPDHVPSAKMELLQELLQETMDSGHKVLLFSQFTSLLAIVRKWLDGQGIRYEYLDGSTKDRSSRVNEFNRNDEIRLFLLSLKAGGVGLNLTSADTVIIYDPWWNPAAEDQAADRTHRIGQTKNVNCIRLAVKDSIEERVLELHDRKRNLFSALVEESSETLSGLSMDDFAFLLGNDPGMKNG